MAESGYKDFEADQWYGVVAPAGTPREMARWKPVIQSGRVKAEGN